MLLAGLIGLLLGVAVFAFARWQSFDRDRSFFPTVLIVIASYYVLFAVIAGEQAAIMTELATAAIFVAIAIAGLKFGPAVVAWGIALHGLFDLLHHLLEIGNGAPVWWPAFCGMIDIVLGLAVLWDLGRKRRVMGVA